MLYLLLMLYLIAVYKILFTVTFVPCLLFVIRYIFDKYGKLMEEKSMPGMNSGVRYTNDTYFNTVNIVILYMFICGLLTTVITYTIGLVFILTLLMIGFLL